MGALSALATVSFDKISPRNIYSCSTLPPRRYGFVRMKPLFLNQYARTPPTAADLERLHASRRAALARVTAQKQKVVSKRQRAERDATEEKRRRDAEACAREDASRAAAVARAEVAAAEKRQRHREAEMVRQTEMNVKRERVAAVLAYDERKADEKEKRVRNDTYRRIQREEKRRELVLQRQEDERMEKIRLHEAGQRYAASTAGVGVGAFRADSVANPARTPAARSARSFFSVAGSTVSACMWAPGQS